MQNSDIVLQLEKTLDRPKSSEKKPLPDIRKAKRVESSPNDYLPEEVLLALTQPVTLDTETTQVSRERSLAVSTTATRKPPANVWNHKNQRDKLKHLTSQALCFCGAGRDISFLYDVPEKDVPKPESIVKPDPSAQRDLASPKKTLELPNSLLPDEYHIVKNKGVLGLEYLDSVKRYHKLVVHKGAKPLTMVDDEYSTKPADHDSHLTVFPSMKPNSRFEVLRLKDVMHDMLEKAGINDETLEKVGPTQMHNLIELIKKEQKIYNIIFHELIRQTTVECNERGELLSEIRQKYSDLLSKVPIQIKGLHDEIMAQRALDRRLTEELFKFKAQITSLTVELTEVKEHDRQITEEAKKTQDDLRAALVESQKNASLLGEYHDLYELQRQRLEKLVGLLTAEKELWANATYSLSIKVIEEGHLSTARRCYTAEKAWSKLAHHFTVLLSDKDTEMLTGLQQHMEKWRDLMESFHLNVKQIEDEVTDALVRIKLHIQRVIDDFRRSCLNKEGAFLKGPNTEKTNEIFTAIRQWATILQGELDKLSGSMLLANNEALSDVELEISGWTECGVQVFNRHKKQDEYPNDYRVMIKLNKEIRNMCSQYSKRITGENGTAKYIIQLNTSLEAWESKLISAVHSMQTLPQSGSEHSSASDLLTAASLSCCTDTSTCTDETRHATGQRNTRTNASIQQAGTKSALTHVSSHVVHLTAPVRKEAVWAKSERFLSVPQISITHQAASNPEEQQPAAIEWLQFMESMDEWISLLDTCLSRVGTVVAEDEKEAVEKIDVHDMMRKAHMWSVTTNNTIDSEDSKYVEQVTQLHAQMVKWMVNMLQRLAPNYPGTSEQSAEQALLHVPQITELVEEALVFFQQLDVFSLLIHSSCEDIVRQRVQDRVAGGDELAERELNDLQGLKYEAYHWIYAACILVSDMTAQHIDYSPLDKKFDMSQFSQARTARSHVLDYMESRRKAEEVVTTGPEATGADSKELQAEGSHPIGTTQQPFASVDVLFIEEPDTTGLAEENSATETQDVKAGEVVSTRGSLAGSKPASRLGSAVKSPMAREEEGLSKIEVIGRDDNTKHALLPEPSPDQPPPRPSSGKPMAVDSQKAYDAMKTVQKLQVQLLETESRAQKAEESEALKAAELVEAQQRLRSLEQLVEELQSKHSSPTPQKLLQVPSTSADATESTAANSEAEVKKKSPKTRPSSQKGKKK